MQDALIHWKGSSTICMQTFYYDSNEKPFVFYVGGRFAPTKHASPKLRAYVVTTFKILEAF